MKLLHQYILLFVLLCLSTAAQAQRFFNLTQREVRVDSVLPHFSYSVPVP
jgi:lipopolysaccharide export LptBFGC system permease protein LptF